MNTARLFAALAEARYPFETGLAAPARWVVDEATGCWNWIGDGKPDFRAKWITGLLGPVPPGKLRHHKCLNGRCVNRDHIMHLTRSEHSKLHVVITHPNLDEGFRS